MSETQRARAQSEKSLKEHKIDPTFTAGVPSSKSEKAPSSFAWPVKEITRHVPSHSTAHTEYRDNYHEWEQTKVYFPPLSLPCLLSLIHALLPH
jgi:hypothetical protein